MSFLSALTPLNLVQEKEKFFAEPTYNPQFIYSQVFSPEELTQWGMPTKAMFDHAVLMVKNNPLLYRADKVIVTEEEVQNTVSHLLDQLQLTQKLEVKFDPNRVTRCGITSKTITFRTPLTYSQEELVGVLHHEVETHFLRRINNVKQPWARNARPDGIFRATEEGLAKLHSYLDLHDKIMKRTFYSYITMYLSQQASFAEVFSYLLNLGLRPATAWYMTLTAKRGLTDTSQPGGMTKNVAYVDGALKVIRWLLDDQNDPHDLYWGRIDIDEIPDFASVAQTAHLKFPTFFEEMPRYRSKIAEICKANQFEKFL